MDLFEASDLFEGGNMMQVQVSLRTLARKAKAKGLQNGMDSGIRYSEKQKWDIQNATVKQASVSSSSR